MQLFRSSPNLPPRFSNHSILPRASLYHDSCEMMVFTLGTRSSAVSWHPASCCRQGRLLSPPDVCGVHAFTYYWYELMDLYFHTS